MSCFIDVNFLASLASRGTNLIKCALCFISPLRGNCTGMQETVSALIQSISLWFFFCAAYTQQIKCTFRSVMVFWWTLDLAICAGNWNVFRVGVSRWPLTNFLPAAWPMCFWHRPYSLDTINLLRSFLLTARRTYTWPLWHISKPMKPLLVVKPCLFKDKICTV